MNEQIEKELIGLSKRTIYPIEELKRAYKYLYVKVGQKYVSDGLTESETIGLFKEIVKISMKGYIDPILIIGLIGSYESPFLKKLKPKV